MTSITLSSHVLDQDAGGPVADMQLVLRRAAGETAATQITDADGRCKFGELELAEGEVLSLTFATGAWYASRGTTCFYPEVEVRFQPQAPGHYHVPLLVNRHGYSTYRGS